VITVTDFTKKEHVERELVLVKVKYVAKDKTRLESMLKRFVGKIIYHKADTVIIEAVGDQQQIKSLLTELDKLGVKELIRTGKIAIQY
jgi:acetolactate synthase-1/3 small subunit